VASSEDVGPGGADAKGGRWPGFWKRQCVESGGGSLGGFASDRQAEAYRGGERKKGRAELAQTQSDCDSDS
jgi:hypothetical protein